MKNVLILLVSILFIECITKDEKANDKSISYQIKNGIYYPDPSVQLKFCIDNGDTAGIRTTNGWNQLSENQVRTIVNPNLPERYQHLDSFPRDPVTIEIRQDSLFFLDEGTLSYGARLKNVTDNSFTLFDPFDFDECYGIYEITYTKSG